MSHEFDVYSLLDNPPFLNTGRLYNFRDKEMAKSVYMRTWLRRTQSLFKWEGLPETIPQMWLELYLQMYGKCAIVKHDEKIYACFGNWGGEPDVYYMPTKFIIANPYLNLNKTFTIGKDCVLAKNDSLFEGLYNLFSRYTTMMVETDISMQLANINSRIISVLSADDDSTRESAREFLNHVADGDMGVIGTTAFFDTLDVQPYGTSGAHTVITDLIELTQYLKASLFNELGLNANYNMKRESINADEAQLNDDMLLPLIDDMLECRKQLCEDVREMYGLEWSVDFASAWEDNQMELELEQESMAQDIQEPDAGEGEDDAQEG